MKPKKTDHREGRLFEIRLSDQINPKQPLYRLSQLLDWDGIERDIEELFFADKGRPGQSTRLVVGLLMLQHMFEISDEQVVEAWVENPYWQYFCGYDYLQWEVPIDRTSLTKWRHRLGEAGLDLILSYTVKAAKEAGIVAKKDLSQVAVDTTVMEKNITYPTDAKLYQRSRERLVKLAKKLGIELRQTYVRVAKTALVKTSRYAHAKQMKRAKKQIKKLKTFLGRVVRDVDRKSKQLKILPPELKEELRIAKRILEQKRQSKNKIYSVHEPDVECISKGKVHKRYEFGNKVSLVLTHKIGLALSAKALHGNPYDGHTLKDALDGAEKNSKAEIKRAFVDKGYRGHGIEDKTIIMSGQKKGMTLHLKRLLKRRQAIEPHIGHMKSDGKLGRNYLRGKVGDKNNAVLVGVGHNLRLIFRSIKDPGFSSA